MLGPALLFCLSFTVMFVALGMTRDRPRPDAQEHRALLRQISGIVIVAMGVFFIAHAVHPAVQPRVAPRAAACARAATGGPMIAGLAFAVAWLPCTGPTLGAILTAASNQDTVGKGGVLLAFYSLGLAVPFMLSALAFAA